MPIDVRWQTLNSWWYSSILIASFVFIKYVCYFKYHVGYLTKLYSPTFLRSLVCLGIFYSVCRRLISRKSHNCWKFLTNFTFDFYVDICIPFNSYSAACFVRTNRFSLLLEWRFIVDVVVVFIFSTFFLRVVSQDNDINERVWIFKYQVVLKVSLSLSLALSRSLSLSLSLHAVALSGNVYTNMKSNMSNVLLLQNYYRNTIWIEHFVLLLQNVHT